MLKKIQDFDVKELLCKRNEIKIKFENMNSISKYDNKDITPNTKYVTYTNINSLYKFLDSDLLRLGCSELSNDYMENKMMSIEKTYDTYICSFYQGDKSAGDKYSQWLAYCSNGGASLEFYFGQDYINLKAIDSNEDYENSAINHFDLINKSEKSLFDYSLLCGDDKSAFYLYPNFPVYVQYCDEVNKNNNSIYNSVISSIVADPGLLAPYFKHSGFEQESEARLAFINKNHRLDRCVKFRERNDGTKSPYIEVKFGDNDKNDRPCGINGENEKELEEAIIKLLNNRTYAEILYKTPIIIPQGNDQEKIYNIVEKVLNNNDFKKENLKIICQGHLPITMITLAPMKDSSIQKKKLEIYCKSKYWLKNVEICESKIPYNTQNNNH
ncbi:MAG: hypothetical protein NC213_00090 [Acetobacter sp.]|nr:hypothetical protein [Bacteroides sp.]MCM1340124.1 hypothetical protein [Acetobacter sp.]MCM1432706.1 hypothetical protein [Clostridiales bacterium]